MSWRRQGARLLSDLLPYSAHLLVASRTASSGVALPSELGPPTYIIHPLGIFSQSSLLLLKLFYLMSSLYKNSQCRH